MKKVPWILMLLTTLFALSTSPAYAKPWSRDKVWATASDAAIYYKMSPSEVEWIADAAVDIVWDGAAESHGHKLTGSVSGCYGLFQFDPSWHLGKRLAKRARRADHNHKHGWRGCRVCSTYRFVRVYRDGGKAAIERHWRATLYR